jgi:hypothetical protein
MHGQELVTYEHYGSISPTGPSDLFKSNSLSASIIGDADSGEQDDDADSVTSKFTSKEINDYLGLSEHKTFAKDNAQLLEYVDSVITQVTDC